MNIRPATCIALSILGLACVEPLPPSSKKSGANEAPDTSVGADAGRKPFAQSSPDAAVSADDDAGGPEGPDLASPPSGGAGGAGARAGARAGAGGDGTAGKAGGKAEPPIAGKDGDTGGDTGGDKEPEPPPDASVPYPVMEPEAATMRSAVGSWSGRVIDSLGPMFDTCITIEQLDSPGRAASVTYVGAEGTRAGCTSTLTLVESNGDVYTFTEKINNGLCFDNGRVVLALRADSTLRYEWYRMGGAVPAEAGTLEMTSSCQ